MSQSIQATTPSMIGERVCAVRRKPTFSNLFPALAEKVRQMSSWSAPRMFTQKAPAAWILGQLVEDLAG